MGSRMNKKGLSYIDWSISIGIFIIFILALFILVVPSLDRRLDENYLVSIAETGLKDNTYYQIYNIPLFIDSLSYQTEKKIIVDLPIYPLFSEYSVVLTKDDFDEVPTEVSNDKLIFGPLDLQEGVNSFDVLYLSEFYLTVEPTGTILSCDELSCSFGVEQKLVGFSINKLENLFSDSSQEFSSNSCNEYADYSIFKNKLNYPTQKEISIFIYREFNEDFICAFKDPEPSDSVYALTWKDKLLNFDGSFEEVNVVLNTW